MRTDIAPAEIAQHFTPSAHPLRPARQRNAPLNAPGSNEPHYGFALRRLDAVVDAPTLHRWFVDERAAFWGMQDKSIDDVTGFYQALAGSGRACAYLGIERGMPAFLIECYDPAHDQVGEHYAVQPGDMGMHLFVAPTAAPVHGYTRRVFAALMTFMFETLGAQRVVVEPDVHNTRIHALNRAMGFVYTKNVAFREKTASIAFCTREDFQAAIQKENLP